MTRGDWFIDKKTLCSKMCIGETYFDQHFLKDDRMRSCEYRRGNKLLWETEKAKKYMKQIVTEIFD
ncbi:hypothetical protein AAT16_09340 [Salinicoccus halodurans]|uniref:Uncharacterized protein n=1 Tax=Salinicoccus halodurans TaxID=407035 RepID=A0ABM5TA67_9STAP|nr:hypothetical protein AAT16_09340 [Salinicoccus halodurans]